MTIAPTLADGAVTIRPARPVDARGSWEQCQDPLSQRWTTAPVPYSMADATTYVESILPSGWADDSRWGFVVEVEGRYAGTISLEDKGARRAEIAYGAHPWVRGTGHMETACRLLLAWGFAERGLHAVLWMANVGNWPSRRLAWRLGFSFGGTVADWMDHRGTYRDGWVGTLRHDQAREPRGRWLEPSPLVGERVRGRPLRQGDVRRIVEACSDERTQHWLGRMPAPYTEADALEWLEASSEGQATGDQVTWAVTDSGGDPILGIMHLFDIGERDCEVGFWAHPDARGRGVTTEAMRLATGFAFDELGVQRVRASAAVKNTASRHVIESCGLRQYAVERLATVLRTGPADVVRYDVLATEWEGR